jgi:hypothetical protein
LEIFHRLNCFRETPSDRAPALPPRALEEWEEFHKKSKLVVRKVDLETRMPNGGNVIPRPEQLEALVSLCTLGHVRAQKKSSAMVYVSKEDMVRFVLETPNIINNAEGMIFTITLNRQPSLILERRRENFNYITWKDGSSGMCLIRENEHETPDCGCQAPLLGNNFEGPYYSLWCLPSEYTMAYPHQSRLWDTTREASGACPQLMNTSMAFGGTVSKYNTALPRLLYRQPLSRLARDAPSRYKPPGSTINFRQRKDVLRCVLTHMNRPEFMSVTNRFTEAAGDWEEENGWTRFPPQEDQKQSTDIKLR